MMKAVLAPAFKARMLGLAGWYSTNILGNRDGEVLDDPESFKTKEESKLGVLEHILQPDQYPELYGNVFHKVRINYYPPRGDNKEGWDNIDIFGWLGYPMQIKVDFLCRDSILAAPIVLDLDLHRIAEPSEDVDVVPPFLVVAAGRIVVDPHLVEHVAVQLGILVRLEDVLEHAEFGLLLGLERFGIVEDLAVPVTQNVRRVPAREPEHARLERGGQHGLHHRLAGLEVFAADRELALLGQMLERRNVDREIGSPVRERHVLHQRGVGVQHRRRT